MKKKVVDPLEVPLLRNNNNNRPKDKRSCDQKLTEWMTNSRTPIVIGLFLCFILGLPPLVYALLTVTGYDSLNSDGLVGAFTYMNSSVSADPIMSIQLIPSSSSCPTGTERLILGTWPGTVAGCFCGGYITTPGCNSTQTYCTNLPAIYQVNLPIWDGESWCVTRATLGTDYVRNTSCPTGFTECWEGNCFSDSVGCPVTNITLSTTPLNNDSVQYNSSKYYTPYRNVGKTGLASIEISIYNIPCFNSLYEPLGQNYELSAVTVMGCDSYGLDSVFSSTLQEDIEYDVLKTNNVSQSIFQLPGYITYLNQAEAYLVARSKIPMSSEEACQNAFTSNLLTQLNQDISTFNDDYSSAYGPSLAGTVSLGMFIFVGSLCICGKMFHNLPYWMLVLISLAHIVSCILLPILACSNYPSHNALANIKALQENNCFPTGQPNQVISQCYNAENTIETMCPSIRPAAIIAPITSLPSALIFWIALLTYKRNNKTWQSFHD